MPVIKLYCVNMFISTKLGKLILRSYLCVMEKPTSSALIDSWYSILCFRLYIYGHFGRVVGWGWMTHTAAMRHNGVVVLVITTK